MSSTGKVYFIGAGPGDLELLTVKGKRLIESANVIIYSDSLINPAVEGLARNGAAIHRSSALTLEEMVDIMVKATEDGKTVARLHTGDPSLFSAVHEQRTLLEEKGIEYEIVPGVSSAFAAAASLKAELTLPGISQTVILSRQEGRTPAPPAEKLMGLASHGATLVLFLSTPYLSTVVKELVEGGYPTDTPVAIVARASWPEEKMVRGTLADIERLAAAANLDNPSIVLVGRALDPKATTTAKTSRSRLYDGGFGHGRRDVRRQERS
ncbi:MAG: precorrin-4 C(11)-methyltransferase [Chloroflexi bacterium]|nr:precorrin-4 C(11)-methyltransferase [Chloroflexota bacterium]